MIKNDSSISFDELISYKLNTGVEAAERFLDDLIAAVNKYPGLRRTGSSHHT
jgi:acyl-homoserine-lactone acylase